MKVGPRNAMVIAVCSLALARRPRATGSCAAAFGSAGPTAGARAGAARRGGRASPSGSPPRRRRSTTSAAPPPTGATRCACSTRARSRGASREDRRSPSTASAREADVWAGESLLYALRERLGLPGSKNACEQGECGSCSVLLDGELVCACLVLAAQADGHEVVTVEGLGRRRRAAPGAGGVRRGRRGAVRLLHAGPRRRGRRPARARRRTRATTRSARRSRATSAAAPATGKIFDAVRSAASGPSNAVSQSPPRRALELGRVGESVRRVDGDPQGHGRVRLLERPLRAPGCSGATRCAARTRTRGSSRIDISAGARACPASTPCSPTTTSPAQKTLRARVPRPARARDRPRPLLRRAGGASSPPSIPSRRAGRPSAIGVEYEPLEPVVDPERATEQEPLHPDRPTMGHGYRDDPRPNVVRSHRHPPRRPRRRGRRVRRAASTSSASRTRRSSAPSRASRCPDGEGGVDIYVATQWLHVDRDQVAPCLGLAPEQVRIHLAGVGGAFGGREDLSMQIHGALLALHTNRPVKIVYSREESFVGHVHRHPARIWAEHRATRDGKLVNVRDADPARRRRVRLELSTAVDVERRLRSRAGRTRSTNALIESHGRLHEQPALRRDARLRRRADLLRGRGADGQARRRARHRPGRAAAAQRARARRHAADRASASPARCPVAEVIRRAAAMPVPEPEELPRDPIRLPGGAGNTTRGEGVRRGVGFAVGFKNICYSEGFDDFMRRARRCSRATASSPRCTAPPPRSARASTNVIAPGRAHRARRPRTSSLAPHTTATVGSAGSASASRMTWMAAGRRAARLPRGARGARAARRRGEVDVERIYRHPRTDAARPRDRPGHRRARARRVRGARRCASSPRSTSTSA